MNLGQKIAAVFDGVAARFTEKAGETTVVVTIAERKSLLSSKKLVYVAKYRVDDVLRNVRFFELLKETGFGLATGNDDLAPGIGFKAERCQGSSGGRTGTIEEKSRLLGKRYDYVFSCENFRTAVEQAAREAGYAFEYRINPTGM